MIRVSSIIDFFRTNQKRNFPSIFIYFLLIFLPIVLTDEKKEKRIITVNVHVNSDALLRCHVSDFGENALLSDKMMMMMKRNNGKKKKQYVSWLKKKKENSDDGTYPSIISLNSRIFRTPLSSIALERYNDNDMLYEDNYEENIFEFEKTMDLHSNTSSRHQNYQKEMNNEKIVGKILKDVIIREESNNYFDKHTSQNKRMNIRNDYVGEWNLNINNIQEEDAGTYDCFFQSFTSDYLTLHRQLLTTIHLNVMLPPRFQELPKIHLINSPLIALYQNDVNLNYVEEGTLSNSFLYVDVMEGDEIELICNFTGSPKTKIKWYKSHFTFNERPSGLMNSQHKLKEIMWKRMPKENGKILKLSSINRNSNSAYKCHGSNSVPPSMEYVFFLNIQILMKISTNQPKISTKLKSDITLSCMTIGYPIDIISWHHISNENDGRVRDKLPNVEDYHSNRYKTISLLKVKKVKKNDFGKYVCSAIQNFRHLLFGQEEKLREKEQSIILYEELFLKNFNNFHSSKIEKVLPMTTSSTPNYNSNNNRYIKFSDTKRHRPNISAVYPLVKSHSLNAYHLQKNVKSVNLHQKRKKARLYNIRKLQNRYIHSSIFKNYHKSQPKSQYMNQIPFSMKKRHNSLRKEQQYRSSFAKHYGTLTNNQNNVNDLTNQKTLHISLIITHLVCWLIN
ncbi:hypothetical protein SNEBB_002202 [Seison nebaliae]|nr:hypothetical protein SNEBB_002202 [Seison nebaliae]